jgi:hypothetical protein
MWALSIVAIVVIVTVLLKWMISVIHTNVEKVKQESASQTPASTR